MSLITVVSAKGSPGATSLCLLLAREFARRATGQLPAAFLVDADPDGGDVALRLGLDPVPGAGTLALAGRHGLDESLLVAHSQYSLTLPGIATISGVGGRAQRSVIEWLSGPLAQVTRELSGHVVVDAGRVGTISSARPLFETSDCVLVACRAHTASIVHARSALISLSSEGIAAKAVVTQETADPPEEIANALGHPLAAVVPIDASTPLGYAEPSKRLPPAAIRHASRAVYPAVRLLASVALGEAKPIALPAADIGHPAPPVAVAAALRAGDRSVPR